MPPRAEDWRAEDWRAGGFGVYVHWPFCAAKCPYCDFNSHVRDRVDQDAWRDALLADLAHEAALLPDHHLTSIFFGVYLYGVDVMFSAIVGWIFQTFGAV